MIRRILIAILFKLLGYTTPKEIDDKRINEWLGRQRSDMGFRMYMQRREISILKSFGVAVNPRNYDILAGQRLEISSLLHAAEIAWAAENKKKLIIKVRGKEDKFFSNSTKNGT